MSESGLPFNDIRALCAMLPPPDAEAMEQVRARNLRLAKPVGALGRLEQLAVWLAGWQGTASPKVSRPLLAIFAGSHGLAPRLAQPVEPGAAETMAQLAAGGAAANQICAVADVGLKVFELALAVPTADISVDAAMSERDCAATVAFGMEAIAGGTDLLCLGAVGDGVDVVGAAMMAALMGGDPGGWLTGEAGDGRAADCVERALALHGPALGDPFEILRRLGGRECAAMVGAILAARLQRVPVLLSGFTSLAAASVLSKLDAGALGHCAAAHSSDAARHGRALAALGLEPVLSTAIDLDDGAGAALAVPHLRAAVACNAEMATRTQASSSGLLN